MDEKAEELSEAKAEAERRRRAADDVKSEKRKLAEEKAELTSRLEASTAQLEEERKRWEEESATKDQESDRFAGELERQMDHLRKTIKQVVIVNFTNLDKIMAIGKDARLNLFLGPSLPLILFA